MGCKMLLLPDSRVIACLRTALFLVPNAVRVVALQEYAKVLMAQKFDCLTAYPAASSQSTNFEAALFEN